MLIGDRVRLRPWQPYKTDHNNFQDTSCEKTHWNTWSAVPKVLRRYILRQHFAAWPLKLGDRIRSPCPFLSDWCFAKQKSTSEPWKNHGLMQFECLLCAGIPMIPDQIILRKSDKSWSILFVSLYRLYGELCLQIWNPQLPPYALYWWTAHISPHCPAFSVRLPCHDPTHLGTPDHVTQPGD